MLNGGIEMKIRITKIVEQYSLEGTYIKNYRTCKDAGKDYCVSYTAIANCCKNKSKSSAGFIWKYKNYKPEYVTKGNIATIKTNNNKTIIIDKKDLERVLQYNWFAHYNKSANAYYIHSNTKYIKGEKRRTIALQRFILEIEDNKIQVDHINHDTTDNRKCNLRACTQHQNSMNRKANKRGSSKYKGVRLNPYNRWVSYIRHNKIDYYIGTFDTQEKAALAYNIKAKELRGEYAFLNIID
jgi:hypothetical protein